MVLLVMLVCALNAAIFLVSVASFFANLEAALDRVLPNAVFKSCEAPSVSIGARGDVAELFLCCDCPMLALFRLL